jgi:hypothetical protein
LIPNINQINNKFASTNGNRAYCFTDADYVVEVLEMGANRKISMIWLRRGVLEN